MDGQREGEDERTREKTKNKKEAGSSLLLFSPPLFPSLHSLPLFFSNACSVQMAVSVNRWLSYIHHITVILWNTKTRYIFSHSVTFSVVLSPIGSRGGFVRGAFWRHWNCRYSLCGDEEHFYLRWQTLIVFGVRSFYCSHIELYRFYPLGSYLLSRRFFCPPRTFYPVHLDCYARFFSHRIIWVCSFFPHRRTLNISNLIFILVLHFNHD